MTDRADDVARRLIRVLPDGDDNPGIDIAGTWFDCADDAPADVQAIADNIIAKLATVLRAYAEEARREEREACAAFVERMGALALTIPGAPSPEAAAHVAETCAQIAISIRARGERG